MLRNSGEKINISKNFKIILLGGSNVGKTSLLLRLTEDAFALSTKSTIGVDFKMKLFSDPRGKENKSNMEVRLQIWDTAGQEKLRSMSRTYYKEIHGCLLIFDLTNKDSFHDVGYWLEELEQHGNKMEKKVLIGNKSDLECNRAISQYEAARFAVENSMEYYECSAKAGICVEEAFACLIEQMLDEDERNINYRRIGMRSQIDMALTNAYHGANNTHTKNINLHDKDARAKHRKKKNNCCK